MENQRTKLESAVANGTFVITAEIVPPLSADGARLIAAAETLGDKVTAINVTDAAAGQTSMSSFAAAALLAANGFEPILQVTCRDRNRISLAGDLIGASAQGVHNVLVLRGDDPSGGDQPDAKQVFDFQSAELMGLARDMRDKGTLPSGREIKPPPRFFIGAADVPRVPDEKWESKWLLKKIEGGAGFIQTQFCFERATAEAYVGRLRDDGITDRLGVIIGVGPIRSARSARWMNENLFGVHVPDPVIERLESSADQAAEGRAICAELVEAFREIDGIAGCHLMAPGGGAKAIAEVLSLLS